MLLSIRKFFFENTSLKQTIFKNTFWLFFAEIISHFLRLILIIFIARVLGAEEYGKFTFALSFVSLLAILSDLGISSLITREFSKQKENEKEYADIISLKMFLSISVAIITFILSFFIGVEESIQKTIWVLIAFIFVDGFFSIFYPFVRARLKMEYEAITKIAQVLITVLLGIIFISIFPSAINLSYAYLVASVVVLTIVAVFFHFFLYFLKISFNFSVWKKLLKNSWPLIFGFIGTWTYINLDSVMIGFWSSPEEVGWYNASARIIFAVIIIFAGIISRSFYPLLSKFSKKAEAGLQKIFNYYLGLMIALSLPMMIGGIVLADKIVDFLYGFQKYEPSVMIFQILIILASASFLYYPYGTMLVVCDGQKKNFFVIAFGILINFILNLILVPIYGFYGAAVSTVISSIVSLILIILFSKYYTPISPFNFESFKILTASFISSIVMFFFIINPVIYKFNLILSCLMGCAVYFLFFLLIMAGINKLVYVKNKKN